MRKFTKQTTSLLLSLPRPLKQSIVVVVDTILCIFGVWFAYYLRLGEFIYFSDTEVTAVLLSIIIGVLFLFGGIYMVFLLSGPVWFIISDLLLAYIPMAWFGFKISLMIVKIKSNKKAT